MGKITHYAGFDWARDHHDVIIVDRNGKIVATSKWKTLRLVGGGGESNSTRWAPAWLLVSRPAKAWSSNS